MLHNFTNLKFHVNLMYRQEKLVPVPMAKEEKARYVAFNLKDKLIQFFSNIRWNIKCLLDDEGNEIPIPKNPNCITAILEDIALPRLNKLRGCGIDIILAKSTREYPDVILEGRVLGNRKIALDIKSTRRISKNRISGFTIGSFAGYFLYPAEKRAFCPIPYSEFDEHWIVGVVYDWNPTLDSLNMVSITEVIVAPKWKIASKSTGTGTTNAIGSIKDLDRLRKWKGDFRSEEEFEKYWRDYGRKKAVKKEKR